MSQIVLVVIVAVAVVAFFVLALSLTLIFKGRHLEMDVGSNREMRKRGIKCASQQIREEERALRAARKEGSVSPEECSEGGCATCTIEVCHPDGSSGKENK